MKKLFFLTQIIFCSFSYSQTPEDFFPMAVGNVWQYRDYFTNQITYTICMNKDSIDSSNNYYVWYNINGLYIRDTLLNIWDGIHLRYKLNSSIGDAWTVYNIEKAIVREEYIDYIFNTYTTIKVIDYYLDYTPDTLWMGKDYLAQGFGVIKKEIEPGILWYLAGCIIDSIQHGIIIEVKNLIEQNKKFTLYPNYPNPFNTSTKIRYELNTNIYVKIDIYNSLGQFVKNLVNQYQERGYHEIYFNSQGMASGIYILRIFAGEYIQSRKMLLVK